MNSEEFRTIKPKRNLFSLNLKELVHYKDLLMFLFLRDIKVMYKQTILGFAWAILQPVMTMIVFSVLFGNLAKIDSNGVPYPIFVFSGLIFWNLFSGSLNSVGMSILSFEKMIRKIYFPRIIIPISSISSHIVNFFIAFLIFIAFSIYYKYSINLEFVMIVIVSFVVSILSALGPGLFLSVVNVKYRDIKFVLPFFIQILLYLTPVIYPVSLLSGDWKYVLALNPMSSFIQLLRDSLFGTNQVDLQMILISLFSMTVFLIIGVIFFNKGEIEFSDQI